MGMSLDEPSPGPAAIRLLSVTTPDEQSASHLASTLVSEGLAACAQVGGPITSWYRWHGEVEQAREWTLTLKIAAQVQEVLVARIAELHPYEVPEIVATEAVGGLEQYLQWVRDNSGVEPC